jgi:hypothetical protein
LDSTRVRRESEPIRERFRPDGEGAGGDGWTNGCPPRLSAPALVARRTHTGGMGEGGGGGGGGHPFPVGFPVPRRGHLVTRFPLVPPLVHVVRFVIRFVGTTVTVTVRSVRSFPARSSLRFVTLSLSPRPLTASCDVPRGVNEISGIRCKKKKKHLDSVAMIPRRMIFFAFSRRIVRVFYFFFFILDLL